MSRLCMTFAGEHHCDYVDESLFICMGDLLTAIPKLSNSGKLHQRSQNSNLTWSSYVHLPGSTQ